MRYGQNDYADDKPGVTQLGTRVIWRRSGEAELNETNFWNAGGFPHTAQAQSFIRNFMSKKSGEPSVDHFYCTPVKRDF